MKWWYLNEIIWVKIDIVMIRWIWDATERLARYGGLIFLALVWWWKGHLRQSDRSYFTTSPRIQLSFIDEKFKTIAQKRMNRDRNTIAYSGCQCNFSFYSLFFKTSQSASPAAEMVVGQERKVCPRPQGLWLMDHSLKKIKCHLYIIFLDWFKKNSTHT